MFGTLIYLCFEFVSSFEFPAKALLAMVQYMTQQAGCQNEMQDEPGKRAGIN
jgi:hypothetical protein